MKIKKSVLKSLIEGKCNDCNNCQVECFYPGCVDHILNKVHESAGFSYIEERVSNDLFNVCVSFMNTPVISQKEWNKFHGKLTDRRTKWFK